MRYLLDTSALLAHHRDEAGSETVHKLLEDGTSEILLSSLTLVEFARRLHALGATQEEALADMSSYEALAGEILSVDATTARTAFGLGLASPGRLPLIDALIAAAACQSAAVLVHRDAHFSGLPKSRLQQLNLADSP